MILNGSWSRFQVDDLLCVRNNVEYIIMYTFFFDCCHNSLAITQSWVLSVYQCFRNILQFTEDELVKVIFQRWYHVVSELKEEYTFHTEKLQLVTLSKLYLNRLFKPFWVIHKKNLLIYSISLHTNRTNCYCKKTYGYSNQARTFLQHLFLIVAEHYSAEFHFLELDKNTTQYAQLYIIYI